MCSRTTCALALNDRNQLRRLCVELAGPEAMDLRDFKTDAAHLLYDVCVALEIEPVVVMDARTVYGIRAEKFCRLWPTLTEAEDEEMVGLDNIRQSAELDEIGPVSEEQRTIERELYRGPRLIQST